MKYIPASSLTKEISIMYNLTAYIWPPLAFWSGIPHLYNIQHIVQRDLLQICIKWVNTRSWDYFCMLISHGICDRLYSLQVAEWAIQDKVFRYIHCGRTWRISWSWEETCEPCVKSISISLATVWLTTEMNWIVQWLWHPVLTLLENT